MPENQDSNLLLTMARDIGQIKTDLAVNTTKTGAIENHLQQLNSKVATQEQINAKQMEINRNFVEQNNITAKFIEEQANLKRRRTDNRSEVLQKIILMLAGPLAIAVWQAIRYLAENGAFK